MQIPARTPAMTAMTAATLDTLSGGRFRLGLGVSGPQVSEGWHGVRFDQPLARTREYVDIVRTGAAPRDGRGTTASTSRCRCRTARARRCKLTVHPVRADIPVYLAAVGPKNLELAGEIADGWLAVFFAPEHAAESLDRDRGPAARRPAGRMAGVRRRRRPCRVASATTSSAAPTRSAATPRCTSAGWAAASRTSTTPSPAGWASRRRRAEVQDLYLARDHAGGAAAVPLRVHRPDVAARAAGADRRAAAGVAEAGVTTLTVTPFAATLEQRLAALCGPGRRARARRASDDTVDSPGRHPRRGRGADRVPAGLQHRAPDDRREAARAARSTTPTSPRSPRSSRSARSSRRSCTSCARHLPDRRRAGSAACSTPRRAGRPDWRFGWAVIARLDPDRRSSGCCSRT